MCSSDLLWTVLLDYVRVGHRKMGDQKSIPFGHKIPSGLPEGRVSTSKSRNLTSEYLIPVEAGHMS